jgi:mannose-6-phosphate isomerase-like protein (cupin superfamily)
MPTTLPFDLSSMIVGFDRDGRASVLESPEGPPLRIDGYTVGAPRMTRNAPHNGEMHPDGDELLYLISGRVTVVLEEAGGERVVELAAGQAIVVPQGTWHRVVLAEPSHLVHITPGPGGEHRPLSTNEVPSASP